MAKKRKKAPSHSSAYSVAVSKGFPFIRGSGRAVRGKWASRFTRSTSGDGEALYVYYDKGWKSFIRKNPTGYPFSSNLFRPATGRGRPRYYRRGGRSWDEVQLREAFYPSPGKPRGYGRRVANPYEIIHTKGPLKGKRARPFLFRNKRVAERFAREHSFGSLAKSDPYGVRKVRKNPVLQVVGLPARFIGNPLPPFLASAMGGAGAGLGFHAVNALLRRNGRKRRRGRR